MKRPNILLMMCDQFRGDALSFKHHPDVKTPYLDTLATQGASFDNAYSACPSCIPARAALFTGKSQVHHGRVGYEDGIDWTYDHMLAQELSTHGYQSQCIGKMHVHPARNLCGFNALKLHDGYLSYYRSSNIAHHQHQEVSDDYLFYLKDHVGMDADISASGGECNSWVVHPWIYEERLHPTNWVANESIRFLKTRDRSQPFFLMSSFVRPHQPFDAPASYLAMYENKTLREPISADWDDTAKTNQYGTIKDSIYGCSNKQNQQLAMAGYYASITHVDHQIGRILLALQEDESYDDTIIVFLSDHGEMLFDHSLYRKVFPYQSSIHIPVILHIGKNIAKTTPLRSDTIVELRDILPTLLELANIPVPEGVDGFSLLPELLGQAKNERPYLHGEHSFHDGLSHQFIVTKQDKFIWFSESGKEQYFDLQQDPNEQHNAIHDQKYAKRINELREILIAELKDREEGYSDGKQLISGCKAKNSLNILNQ